MSRITVSESEDALMSAYISCLQRKRDQLSLHVLDKQRITLKWPIYLKTILLRWHPTNTIKNKLINTLRSWKKENNISDQSLQNNILLRDNPKMYGILTDVLTMHRRKATLGPTISSIEGLLYNTAKVLAAMISPLAGITTLYILNWLKYVSWGNWNRKKYLLVSLIYNSQLRSKFDTVQLTHL